MGYFDDRKNVETYIQMAEGYDGASIISVLESHLPAGSRVLELGMGPGKDLDLLSRTYVVTGSDSSPIFLELHRRNHPGADLLELDAATIDTDRIFDCVYSNKVLQHLSTTDLRRSLARQEDVLAAGGLAMHTLWYGEGEEVYDGLRTVYYKEDTIHSVVGNGFEVVDITRYGEIEDNDSMYVLLRKVT